MAEARTKLPGPRTDFEGGLMSVVVANARQVIIGSVASARRCVSRGRVPINTGPLGVPAAVGRAATLAPVALPSRAWTSGL